MEQDLQARALGLYIHIPWCLTRCPYCNFFALPYSKAAFEDYYALLCRHKELSAKYLDRPLSSVYFGGGTPSLLSPEQISSLLEGLDLAFDAEITLEVNPIQITPDWAHKLSQSPINRISLGLQSMNDAELIYLGRRHRVADIPTKIQILHDAGFGNISADMIYGLPDSKLEHLHQNLDAYLSLPLQHISTYLLELEPQSPLAEDINRIPPDEQLKQMYHLIRQSLIEAGYSHYEISNFAALGNESRHNLLYWQSEDCWAWGASAWGYFNRTRYHNPADIPSYAQQLHEGNSLGIEDIEADDEADYIMMRLRLLKGINLKEFYQRFGKDFFAPRAAKISQLKELGMLEQIGDYLRLSSRALFISNAVIGQLI